MNRKLKVTLLVFFSLVFCVTAGFLVRDLLEYKKGDDIYAEAAREFIKVKPLPPGNSGPAQNTSQDTTQGTASSGEDSTQEESAAAEPEPAPERLVMDFEALAGINKDIIGWIKIPGTNINYPLLQGADNDYYLRRNYRRETLRAGSIFLDYRCDPGMGGKNSIIHGHNMRNGSMFSQLLKFGNQSFYNSHKYIFVYTADGYLKYEIFSCRQVSVEGATVFQTGFGQGFDAVLGQWAADSQVTTGVVPGASDKIVTLSTCENQNDKLRFVVQGRLVEDTRGHQEPEEDPADADDGQDATGQTEDPAAVTGQ